MPTPHMQTGTRRSTCASPFAPSRFFSASPEMKRIDWRIATRKKPWHNHGLYMKRYEATLADLDLYAISQLDAPVD